jgi:DNA polymerase III psi subunit
MTIKNRNTIGLTTMAALAVFVLFTNNSAFAASSTDNLPEIKATEEIKKNPLLMKVLKNIEISKKKIAEMQKKQLAMTEQKKFLDTQRKIAQEKFQSDLARMNKEMESFTPRASFTKFLSGINGTHHAIFWSQFNYQEQKVNLARTAMNDILKNGGTYADARNAFSKVASMTRTEIVGLLKDQNIQHGFANPDVQKAFDQYGKLPRTRD